MHAAGWSLGAIAAMLLTSGGVAHEAESVAEAHQAVGGGTGPIDPPPGGLFAQVNTDSQIQLVWRCGSNQAALHRVLRSEGSSGAPSEIWSLAACRQGQVRFVFSGVQPATEYCFTVIAENENHAEAAEPFCVTSALDTAAPVLPRITVTDRQQFHIVWDIVDLATNESYIALEYRELGTSTWRGKVFDRGVRAHRATGPVATLQSVMLEPATTYEYRSRIGHELAPVHVTSPIQLVETAPPPPEIPRPERLANITHDQATVFWGDVEWETEYVVRVVRTSTGAIEKTKTVGANQTSATITGLQSSTEYAVDIEARSATGPSGRSFPLFLLTKAALVISHTSSVILQKPEPPITGWLPYSATFGPWNNNARLSAIRPIANFPTLRGLRFIRAGRPTSDCEAAGQFRFVAVGASLGIADFTFLYGGSDLSRQITLLACGEFGGQPPSEWRPYVDIDWVEQP